MTMSVKITTVKNGKKDSAVTEFFFDNYQTHQDLIANISRRARALGADEWLPTELFPGDASKEVGRELANLQADIPLAFNLYKAFAQNRPGVFSLWTKLKTKNIQYIVEIYDKAYLGRFSNHEALGKHLFLQQFPEVPDLALPYVKFDEFGKDALKRGEYFSASLGHVFHNIL